MKKFRKSFKPDCSIILMRKALLILSFLFFLLTLLVIQSIPVHSISNTKIDSQVYKNLQNSSKVRVIIQLNTGQSGKTISSLSLSDNNVRKILGNLSINHDFGNALSADISDSQLSSLQNDPNVASVTLDGVKHINLQDSVPLINGTQTWQLKQNGINLTGIGQTVCIIDTGVNYTHPDLGNCTTPQFLAGNCSKVIGGFDFVNNNNNPMDDNGHGTHVAGIVGANGGIKGVAPDAKIVALKVCDSSGSCIDSNLLSAIDWCVGNASIYNISVISMSLGGQYVYNTYCDTNATENSNLFAQHINAATAKNISVVIASGNGINNDENGQNGQVSSPGCVQNATSVGSTTKSDVISTFSNRWTLGTIFAPGESINSTMLAAPPIGDIRSLCGTGNIYCQLSGTSMATPHVAATIAIINQYLKLTNQSRTPNQIASILNSTGKTIPDSSSGLNFSRINVYNAIISLDNQAPNVTLVSPANNFLGNSSNQTFSCNATNLALQNVTFYLWKSNGTIYNQSFKNISGASNTFSVNVTNISLGIYKWNCLYTDQNNNVSSASSNFSFYTLNPYSNLDAPINQSAASANQSFSCDGGSTFNLTNVTFYLWNSSSNAPINTSYLNITGKTNMTSFNYTFTAQDNYKWNCLYTNNQSNQTFGQNNFSITYDITPPNLTLIQPLPTDATSSSASENFSYNATDNLNIANCSLIINNNINLSSSSVNQSATNSFAQIFSPGAYNWSINCTDFGNNVANSSTQIFTISAPVSNSGSGGSTGGGGG